MKKAVGGTLLGCIVLALIFTGGAWLLYQPMLNLLSTIVGLEFVVLTPESSLMHRLFFVMSMMLSGLAVGVCTLLCGWNEIARSRIKRFFVIFTLIALFGAVVWYAFLCFRMYLWSDLTGGEFGRIFASLALEDIPFYGIGLSATIAVMFSTLLVFAGRKRRSEKIRKAQLSATSRQAPSK